MKIQTLLAIATALLVSSCASRYTSSPPDAGASPNPDALLKSMSTRLASTKQYRFTAHRTIAADPASCYAYFHKAKSLESCGRKAEVAAVLRAGLARARALKDNKAANEIESYLDDCE